MDSDSDIQRDNDKNIDIDINGGTLQMTRHCAITLSDTMTSDVQDNRRTLTLTLIFTSNPSTELLDLLT